MSTLVEEEANTLIDKSIHLDVIRRNGDRVPFHTEKIRTALMKAFLAVEGDRAENSTRIQNIVQEISVSVAQTLERRLGPGRVVSIEDIQDQVELGLMRQGEYQIAKAYVLYRETQRKARAEKVQRETQEQTITITAKNGEIREYKASRLQNFIKKCGAGLADVDSELLGKQIWAELYPEIPEQEIYTAGLIATRSLIEKSPEYSKLAANILLYKLLEEAAAFLEVDASAGIEAAYPQLLSAYIEKGIALEQLDPRLKQFDLNVIIRGLAAQRDQNFHYLGLQTLYDRYFIHHEGTRYELPQLFFMRVAMGLALNEDEKEKRALEFYDVLSQFYFMSSTPTLFNAGTLRPQLSSCYLSTVSDDLQGIFKAVQDNAMLSKYAGGLGNDWTPVRALGSRIKGTNGKSLGVVPFLNVANATTVAVNQGGKRKGALCAYLETWHLDIEEFLELRKNTGDDRRRTHDMNTANWIPDLFMQRLFNDEMWTLFSPNEVPELHDLYGEAFTETYEAYEAKAQKGELKQYKEIKAKDLWRKMLSMLYETGHPWITFKDPCNVRSPQQHVGVVHNSNLCTEITLNTSTEETAVCNLGSINLPAHFVDGKLDKQRLMRTIHSAIRMLDNVIDINFYPIREAKHANMQHRPIGLGIMGFQDVLYKLGVDYASDAAVQFADESMELISYLALTASSDLAAERGAYASYQGSLWSQGILPIDSLKQLQALRGEHLELAMTSKLDWDSLREKVQQQGMRNSNVLAIAPTATIANICGVSASIEPTYQNLYVKSNLSGEFTIVNPHLVADLKALALWDDVMVNDLKYYNGSVAEITRIPENIRKRYATAFEIDPSYLVEAGARRQKWLDQSQSLNLYMASPSGAKLDKLYRLAWLRGLKTTYYLRSLGATNTEKATIHSNELSKVLPKACSIDDPDCEACQ